MNPELTVIGAIAVATLSGLTVLAFKHHAAFRRLLGIIQPILGFCFLGLLIWDFALEHAASAISDAIPDVRWSEARKAIRPYYLAKTWVIICYFAGMIYLAFLEFGLPYIMSAEQPETKPEKEEPK